MHGGLILEVGIITLSLAGQILQRGGIIDIHTNCIDLDACRLQCLSLFGTIPEGIPGALTAAARLAVRNEDHILGTILALRQICLGLRQSSRVVGTAGSPHGVNRLVKSLNRVLLRQGCEADAGALNQLTAAGPARIAFKRDDANPVGCPGGCNALYQCVCSVLSRGHLGFLVITPIISDPIGWEEKTDKRATLVTAVDLEN